MNLEGPRGFNDFFFAFRMRCHRVHTWPALSHISIPTQDCSLSLLVAISGGPFMIFYADATCAQFQPHLGHFRT